MKIKDFQITWVVLLSSRKLWRNIVVNEPLSRDENESQTQRKCWSCDDDDNLMYTAISLTNKNETKCGLQNENYAKMSLHFRWPKRDETKCYNVISSRLVALLFCSISVSCDLTLLQGLSGLPGFRKTKPAQLLLKTSPIAFRGGFPGKVPGSKYLRTWQHSAQTQATSVPQAPLAALFRRRQQTKGQRKGSMAFIWLQFTSNTSNRHTRCSSSIQAPCFSLLNLNVTLYIFSGIIMWCYFFIYCFIYLNLCVCTSNMFGW